MKRIIFRNPFVSKTNKGLAKTHLIISGEYFKLADCCDDTEEGIKHKAEAVYNAAMELNKAAKLLGFRNMVDMLKYIEIHNGNL